MPTADVICGPELAAEAAELLPTRQTLDLINIVVAPVTAINLALAINAATINSTAQALAAQWLTVLAHP